MHIILSRHGNTFSNGEETVWIGAREDPPLTDEGRRQAHALGKAMKAATLELAAVHCGPLQRTREYARIVTLVLGQDRPPVVDERLREIDYGAWSGLSSDEIARRFGEKELSRWRRDGVWPRGAEWRPSESEILGNVRSMLSAALDAHGPGGCVLLVTSNGIMRFFLKFLVEGLGCRADPGKGRVATGRICEIAYGDDGAGCEILSWNAVPETVCRPYCNTVPAPPGT